MYCSRSSFCLSLTAFVTVNSKASDLFCSFSNPAIKYTISCNKLVTALLSLCDIVPFSNLLLIDAKTLQASFAKSKSRTSTGDTDRKAKASLSSLLVAHPTCAEKYDYQVKNICLKIFYNFFSQIDTYLGHYWFFVVLIYRHTCRMYPRICTNMVQSYER